MPMRIQCISCQNVLTVSDTLRGKAIRCPHCQAPTRVPGRQATQLGGSAPQRSMTHVEGFSPLEPRVRTNGGVRRKTMLAPQYSEPEHYAPPPDDGYEDLP